MADRPDFPKFEEEVLAFWRENDVFKKTLAKPPTEGNFVFFEGPPTGNGKPGIHHIESRSYKDVVLRYKTMRGFHVDRKAGWDTHGLPVEIQVEKKLGVSGKPQIEDLVKGSKEKSIAKFNALCKESVWEYLVDWKAITERVGVWFDLEHPYITYTNDYIESLWWIVKQISERGLLYRDYKVVPYCTRCGTPLSSHELAQGYEEIEDESVYVKFKVKNQENTYFLAWTTTPWTLPGNVALAVGNEVTYVKVKQGNDFLILAKARLGVLENESEIVQEFSGNDLLGSEYEPLYSFVPLETKAHFVVPADFVSTEDGTGIVHTAVMYGAEDFELGQKIGLPKQHLVDLQGHFIDAVTKEKPEWAHVFVRDLNPKITDDLRERNLLVRTETVRHTYPFCWRCKTPLLYYAKESWFVKMSALREKLLAANDTVNWVPDYIKNGRFGEWLREVKDWAFSRERYWGTPLPAWVCDNKGCGHTEVIGSYQELLSRAKKRNTYHIMRHGEAVSNVENVVSSKLETSNRYPLTPMGEKRVSEAAEKLKGMGITKIVASPFYRIKQTAEIASKALGVPVEYRDELQEIHLDHDGKPVPEYTKQFTTIEERFTRKIGSNETWNELAARMLGFLRDLDRSHEHETILVCTHGDGIWLAEWALSGLSEAGIKTIPYPDFDSPTPLPFVGSLVNDAGKLDPHRPFIDSVTVECSKCNNTMHRTPEVIDVWFDSGAMPFAQWHYPFENKDRVDQGTAFPADYISEAIDQTRGWFYTLLAVSVLLERGAPYKNIICLGHIVDAKGKKMSKSIGNVVDPWEMVNKFGADAVRLFMFTVSQPGDTKRFDPADLDRIVKQTFMILWNVLAFWKLYNNNPTPYSLQPTPSHIMDQWILARLTELVATISKRMDGYDVTASARSITEFITDLSTWYIRRSRDRFKIDATKPIAVLGYVLATLAKVMAPFTPFIAEKLHHEVGGTDSVHGTDWPTVDGSNESLLTTMATVRSAAELGHAKRAAAGIRVRQPLARVDLTVTPGVELSSELQELLADELNVKEVRVSTGNEFAAELDTVITPELKHEGWVREIVRQVNDLRREAKLTIHDRITLTYDTDDAELLTLFTTFEEALKIATRADAIRQEHSESGKDLELSDTQKIWLGIVK